MAEVRRMTETSPEATQRREPVPFYPLIVAAFPVVSVFSANLAYVPTGQLLRPLVVVVLGAGLLVLVLGALLRDAARGAAAATALVIGLFGYAWFVGSFGQALAQNLIPPFWAWAVLTVAAAPLAARTVRRTKGPNVLASFIALIALVNLGFGLARSARLAARAPRAALGSPASDAAKPDVFYIILDGHGRSDSIRRAMGYDNAPFVAGLRRRGFFVAEGSHSNYCQTELSLASSLNMDDIPRLLPRVGPQTEDRQPLAALIDDNEVARRFRAQGYRFLAVTSGFPPVTFASADLHLGSRWGGTMVESTLLQMTPFAQGGVVDSQFDARRRNLLGAFDNLAALAQPTAGPRFVVAHILAPHPPFVFNADGTPRPRVGAYGYWDGDDYTTFAGGKPEDYRKGYAAQVAWVERQTLAAVDALLAAADPQRRPIVIVQGDHGSKLHLAQNSLDRTDLHECFPILNAYLVPDSVRKDLHPGITPVNSFRVLFRDLFGAPLPPLPDRSWYSRYATPYDFTDVTDRIEPVAVTSP